jgi:putative oxidoreductase
LIAAIFLVSGIAKVTDFSGTVGYMRGAGLPATEALAAIAAVIELGCGLALLIGAWARPAGLLLALYLIPVTLVFHAFWNYTGMDQRMQLINFLKNLAIMGGLSYVATYGPGLFAVDAHRRRRAALQPPSVRPFARVPIGT